MTQLLRTDRNTLLKPVQSVAGIVNRATTLPILANVLIERGRGVISLTGTDLDIQATTTVARADGADMAITVAARKLQDILRALPESAEVTLDVVDARLIVKAGKSRFNLQTIPAEDFPRFVDATDEAVRITLPQMQLKRLLALVQYAMARQDIRYYLLGALLVAEGSMLAAVATDGHRLAFAQRTLEQAVAHREVILPLKVVTELTKLLADTDEPMQIDILGSQVRFAFGQMQLVTKVIDGKFPDYRRLMPTVYANRFQIDRLLLLQALQGAAILSHEKHRGVRLVLAENSLGISCTNSYQEEALGDVEIEYQGAAIDAWFNVTYLTDVLSNLSVPVVECAFGTSAESALITIPGDDSFRYVAMPMRM